MKSGHNQKIGRRGEALATRYLLAKGYSIMAENHREGNLEIDLIVRDNKKEELVFVEVKTRTSSRKEKPEDAVDSGKQAALIAAADAYLYHNALENSRCRFDVIAITLSPDISINHIEDAFWADI